ncbi:hypothetical protein NXV80_05580 [Bacteroides ovatus]|nr:hypothetical protein [Bacteroides ovatus]
MKFLNHSIGFCLLLTLLCYSCASDYLDTAPTNQVSPADLFKDGSVRCLCCQRIGEVDENHLPH